MEFECKYREVGNRLLLAILCNNSGNFVVIWGTRVKMTICNIVAVYGNLWILFLLSSLSCMFQSQSSNSFSNVGSIQVQAQKEFHFWEFIIITVQPDRTKACSEGFVYSNALQHGKKASQAKLIYSSGFYFPFKITM